MKYFFTSDTHFGHFNIIKYTNRPFCNSDEMDYKMIKYWNNVVNEDDIIYHLGDVSFHNTRRTLGILHSLKGRIHLILGNHDKKRIKNDIINRFESISNYTEICINKQWITLCHYPLLSWNGSFRTNSWMLHGHCHGTLNVKGGKRLDVGVDTHDFKPWSFEEIKSYMSKINHIEVDHHKKRK